MVPQEDEIGLLFNLEEPKQADFTHVGWVFDSQPSMTVCLDYWTSKLQIINANILTYCLARDKEGDHATSAEIYSIYNDKRS